MYKLSRVDTTVIGHVIFHTFKLLTDGSDINLMLYKQVVAVYIVVLELLNCCRRWMSEFIFKSLATYMLIIIIWSSIISVLIFRR